MLPQGSSRIFLGVSMIFSVVTPSFNCHEFILRNIHSVRDQGFGPNELEHWIVDGGSTDGTLELLAEHPDVNWISEPDQGLSDAVNKGILRSKGEWIVWLNADDYLAPDALRLFLRFTESYPDIRIFAGAQTYLGYDGSPEQTVKGWDYNLEELLSGHTEITQASTFVHREVYKKVGLLDVHNRFAMDYEWLVRAMHQYKCVPIPDVLSFYQRRRNSITDVHMVEQFKEFIRLRRRHNRPRLAKAELFFRFYIYTNPLRRIRALRRTVRWVKRLFGKEPQHPF
jgi:glycosyltransferase involved in cell wall biosynthesis